MDNLDPTLSEHPTDPILFSSSMEPQTPAEEFPFPEQEPFFGNQRSGWTQQEEPLPFPEELSDEEETAEPPEKKPFGAISLQFCLCIGLLIVVLLCKVFSAPAYSAIQQNYQQINQADPVLETQIKQFQQQVSEVFSQIKPIQPDEQKSSSHENSQSQQSKSSSSSDSSSTSSSRTESDAQTSSMSSAALV